MPYVRKEHEPKSNVDNKGIPFLETTPDPSVEIAKARDAAEDLGALDVVKAIDEFRIFLEEEIKANWQWVYHEQLQVSEEFRKELRRRSCNLGDEAIDMIAGLLDKGIQAVTSSCREHVEEDAHRLLWKWIERTRTLTEAAEHARRDAYPYYKQVVTSYRRWRGLTGWCDFNKILEEKHFTDGRRQTRKEDIVCYIAVTMLYAHAEEADSPQKKLLEDLLRDGEIPMLIELAKRDPKSFIEAAKKTGDSRGSREGGGGGEETSWESIKDHKFEETYAAILGYGRMKGSFTAGDIMGEQGVSRRTAKSRLAELKAMGLITIKESTAGRETVYTLKA